MVAPFYPVVAQQLVVAALLQIVDHSLGLGYRHGAVGGTMHNPQGHLAQPRGLLHRTASAERHGSCHLVGIGCHKIHRAVASQAHAQDIDAGGVDGIVCHGPLQQVVDFLGVPRSTSVLRRQHHSRHNLTLLYGVEHPVAAHLFQIVATQTGAVEEYDQRHATSLCFVLLGSEYPEVVASRNLAAHGLHLALTVGGCMGGKRREPQQGQEYRLQFHQLCLYTLLQS